MKCSFLGGSVSLKRFSNLLSPGGGMAFMSEYREVVFQDKNVTCCCRNAVVVTAGQMHYGN